MRRLYQMPVAIAFLLTGITNCVIMTNEQVCLRNIENQMYLCTSAHPDSQQADLELIAYFALNGSESARKMTETLLLSCAVGKMKTKQCAESAESKWITISIKQ